MTQSTAALAAASQEALVPTFRAALAAAERLRDELAHVNQTIEKAAASPVPVCPSPVPPPQDICGYLFTYSPCIVTGPHIKHQGATGRSWSRLADEVQLARRR